MPRRDHIDERVIVLAPTGRDGPLTAEILVGEGIATALARDVEHLCALVEEGAAAALLAEEALVPAAAQRLAALVARQEPWSDLPIILFTGERGTIRARRPTFASLAPLGNVTLLERPAQIITLVSAVRAAIRARHRQYATRGHLESLAASVKNRDQFLATLGHELRTPLSAINMAGEALEREGYDRARARGIIRRQTAKLARLVEDLLDVSRVGSDKIVLRPTRVDLREVVARALEGIEGAAQRAGVRLGVALPAEPVVVEGDPARLDQIVANLAANAVKYTPSGGSVSVRVDAEGGAARIQVRDTGIGIAPHMLARIFEPFAQAERALDRAQGGLGLGLALVRGLVALHGGTVRAESGGVGAGSLFLVELPTTMRARPPVAPTSPPPSVSLGPPLPGPRRVLVVEDNDDNRETVVMVLEQLGFGTAATADGPSGVRAALEQRPDAAVVDIGLPGFDGYEVARRIRSGLGDAVLLVALTGYGQPEDRERALAAGFDVHLTKPADVATLGRVLAGRAGERVHH
jgi:signal transduction histidine kinase